MSNIIPKIITDKDAIEHYRELFSYLISNNIIQIVEESDDHENILQDFDKIKSICAKGNCVWGKNGFVSLEKFRLLYMNMKQ